MVYPSVTLICGVFEATNFLKIREDGMIQVQEMRVKGVVPIKDSRGAMRVIKIPLGAGMEKTMIALIIMKGAIGMMRQATTVGVPGSRRIRLLLMGVVKPLLITIPR